MKRITSSVYVEDRFSVPPDYRGCNPSFVVTSDGVVMVDTPYMPSDALRWRSEIDKMGTVRYILNTDHHPDHTTGNFFFPGVAVSHDNARESFMAPLNQKTVKPGQYTLERALGTIRKYDPEGAHLVESGYQPKPPTLTFSDRLSLYVGEKEFQLRYLPGHTASNIGIYLLPDKVFFSGDNFTSATQPSLADSVPRDWVRSLKKIEAMDIDFMVPGHGEVSDKGEVRQFRLFIEKCIALVTEAIRKGMSKDEAAETLSFEDLYPGRGRIRAVHPGAEQQRRNVLRLYEMLSG